MLIPILNVKSMTKDELRKGIDELDKSLSSVPFIIALEKQLGIQKVHLAGIATVGMILFVLVFNNLHASLLTDLVGYIYPAYMSLKAVGATTAVQGQWLGYWTIFGLFNLMEYARETLLHVFPYYYTFKLLIVIWLISPSARGAATVYELLLKPLLPVIDAFIEAPRKATPVSEGTPAAEKGAARAAPAAEEVKLIETEVVLDKADGKKPDKAKTDKGRVRWGYVKLS
ncbi:TB2/DP1, HVA22 family-domain-containing protein [Powellomyces hirtus]|nr:TB2/DP1, HVA22 family-domain-containing protein [Powellomyces hirtus]